jgi:EAL domain-containing protein (putative c-di-GMP-specific phosphodiesterase class I)
VSLFRKPAPDDLTAAMSPPAVGLPGEPYLEFQPAVDLASGQLVGFEALLRWVNGAGGSIPPDILIPWAEDRGQMTALNAWVLSEACHEAACWPAELTVAVNCSVFQLRRGEAAIAAASALEHSGLDPRRLTIEVTEDSVTDDDATADLRVMHRLGIQVALDDVGPDWSVLTDLPDFIVNTMKIDAVLVAGLVAPEGSTRTVVEAIVNVSRSLGISTVAEAVETADQVAVLRELGVQVAQGYFFSRPLAVKDASALAAATPLPTFPLYVDDDVGDEPVTAPAPPGEVLSVDDGAGTPSPVPTPPAEPAAPPPATIKTTRPPTQRPAPAAEAGDPEAMSVLGDGDAPPPSSPVPPVSTLQAAFPIPPRTPASDGPVPDQAPVPVTRKRVAPTVAHRPGPEDGNGHVGSDPGADIGKLNRVIERLAVAVERLNGILETGDRDADVGGPHPEGITSEVRAG